VLNCSLRSRGSRSKPPSSSHLVKRQESGSWLHSPMPFHHLLLQIGGARSGRVNRSRSGCVRFSAQARKRTFGKPDNGACAVTCAKTFLKATGS
jgi:hypothetical protein